MDNPAINSMGIPKKLDEIEKTLVRSGIRVL